MTAHRVGIMGGTFDPVHRGHLIAAHRVSDALSLETVLLSPVARPWHKPASDLAPAADRIAMLELAIEDAPDLRITTVDIDRGGDTFTIDTLADLEAQFARDYPGEGLELFFIAGADAIAGLASWKSPDELLQRARFVAVSRPGYAFVLPELAGAEAITVLEIEAADTSSTLVRERAALGQPLGDLVPARVAEYIVEHGLYSSSHA